VANLTLSIDDELLKRARIRAIEEGTSVNAVVRAYLERYAHTDTREAAMRRFLDIAAASGAGRDGAGRAWTRDDIYEHRDTE
jgi:plasmid stability protein